MRGPGTTKISEATATTRLLRTAAIEPARFHSATTDAFCCAVTPAVSDISPISRMTSGLRARHVFERYGRIRRGGIAKDVHAADDRDYFVQVRRLTDHDESVESLRSAAYNEHDFLRREFGGTGLDLFQMTADILNQFRCLCVCAGGRADLLDGAVQCGDAVLIDFQNVAV